MLKIIAFNSFRGGTGKSNIIANFAIALARLGKRVGIVDVDLPSPGIHILFSLDPTQIDHTLNDYLWGLCDIGGATYDITPEALHAPGNGCVFLSPASFQVNDINRIIQEGYDIDRLSGGINDMGITLDLDYLLVDTHPGLNQETLLAMTLADQLVLVLRPDSQDFQGTAVTVDVSQKLGVPDTFVLLNRVLPALDRTHLTNLVTKAYHLPILGMLPNADEVMLMASRDLFLLRSPDHPFSQELTRIAETFGNSA